MINMRKGYELLKSGDSPYSIQYELFEKEYQINIPISFKRFSSNIRLGSDENYSPNFDLIRVYDTVLNNIIAIGTIKAKTDSHIVPNIEIDRIIPNDKLIVSWKSAINSDKLFQEQKLLPIGYLYEPVNTRLLLDTRKETSGSICCDLNEELKIKHNSEVEYLFSDIWSMVEKCYEEINEDLLLKYHFPAVFKNWGEDFWRTK